MTLKWHGLKVTEADRDFESVATRKGDEVFDETALHFAREYIHVATASFLLR